MTGILAVLAAEAQKLAYTNISGSVSTSLIGGGTCSVTLTVNRAGTWQMTNTNGTPSISPSGVQTWVTPGSAAIGDSHWVRASNAGPDAPTGSALGSWIQLSSNQAWILTAAPASTMDSVLTVSIATDAAGANVVSTGAVTLHADND